MDVCVWQVKILPLTPMDPFSAPLDNAAFQQVRHFVRHNARVPLYRANPDMLIMAALESITTEQATGYFRMCGYGPSKLELAEEARKRKRRKLALALYLLSTSNSEGDDEND